MTVEQLYTSKARWCQHYDALTALGASPEHSVKDPAAVRWCLGGAIALVYGHDPDMRSKVLARVLDILKTRMTHPMEADEEPSVSGWNDEPDRKFPEVRALVVEARI